VLDVVAALGGASWNVAVRPAGTSLEIERPTETLRGTGAIRTVDGWLRQRKPLVPRYHASALS